MRDYASEFVDLFEGVSTPTTPKTRRDRYVQKQEVDFDQFFDELIEEHFVETTESTYFEEDVKIDIEEPVECITEDVVTPQSSSPEVNMMDDLTNKLSTYLTRTNTKYIEPDPQDFSVVVENLQRQIQDVRRLVLENTVVSGIGQGGDGQGPGSGEVWFKRLDDVDMDGLEPGDSIIWDGNKWRPQKHCYSVDGGPSNQSIYEYYLDAHSGTNLPNMDVSGNADGGSAAPNDCDDTYELRNSLGEINQSLTELASKAIIIEG